MRGLKSKVVISIAVTIIGTLFAVMMLKSVMTAVHHAELLEAQLNTFAEDFAALNDEERGFLKTLGAEQLVTSSTRQLPIKALEQRRFIVALRNPQTGQITLYATGKGKLALALIEKEKSGCK